MTIRYADAVQEQLPATDTTIYTCPTAAKSAHVIYGNCACEDATGTSFVVNIVQSGGSVAVTNQYIPLKSIASKEVDPLDELTGCVLMPGDFISAIATDASRLNFKIGIKEIY